MVVVSTQNTNATSANNRVALILPYGIENRGVRYIAAVLRRNGFEAHLVFLKRWVNNQLRMPTPREEELLAELMGRIDPVLVGFGFGAPYFRLVKSLTERLRKSTGACMLWGGVFPTICPEDCIPHADAVCVGEGEYPTLDLACALRDGRDFSAIPNLWVRNAAGIARNPPRPLIADLDTLPFPDYMQPGAWFIEDDRLQARDPVADTVEYRIYPTRGCPYACTYCHNSVLREVFRDRGRYYRTRSVPGIIAELEYARRILPRIRRVKFDGDVFAFSKAWLAEFAREYARRIGIRFELLTYPGELDEEDLALLKSAGLCKIQTGLQSGSDREVQAIYGRSSKAADIRELTRIVHRVGIAVVYDIIFDNPLATMTDKRAMVELVLELERPFSVYLYSLTVFPKTSLARELLARGLIRPEDVEGQASKSFRQFRLSLDYPRQKEDIFWISLTILAAKRFVPRFTVRRAMDSRWLMAHPWPLKRAAQAADIVKAGLIALGMLAHGELTLFKIRQYGSFHKVISQ